MGSYVSGAEQEQQEMLREIGYAGFREVFSHIPDEVMLEEEVDTPSGLSERTIKGRVEDIAGKNVVFHHIFRGTGVYSHYIPATVSSVTSKKEFVTAYTPYQAEISQGILQSMSKYQTIFCELTGMDTSNASIYDGVMAAAEVIAVCRERKETIAHISTAANPGVTEVMKTYYLSSNIKVVTIPEKDGVTDAAVLKEVLKTNLQSACFYVRQPNYYGNVEDGDALGRIVHEAGTKYTMGCNPTALAVMKTPAEYGADIAVENGQPLDIPLALGGLYLGFMTATAVMTRKLPGRIVGETADNQGRRAFVLTFQTRGQHIRREEVSSNVCPNQVWCALAASVHMTAIGTDGTVKAADRYISKAYYLRDALKGAGLGPKRDRKFSYKLTIVSPRGKCMDSAYILRTLESRGTLGGLPFSDRGVLRCATKMNTREEMGELVFTVQEALYRECGQEEVCGS